MIKKLFFKIILLSSPLILLISLFIINDPFKIIYEYDDYSPNEDYYINRDFISSKIFIKNYPKYKYNSFIFGSSRTMAYNPQHWKNYLDSNSSVFSFDSFGESIFGIYSKIKYLDNNNVNINNCLLIFCEDVTFQFSSDHPGHIYMKAPFVAKTSYLNFYFEHFKAFIQKDFFYNYYKKKLVDKKLPINQYTKYDTINNHMKNLMSELKIKRIPKNYIDSNFIKLKNNTNEKQSVKKINVKHIQLMRQIMSIFKKQKTKYKIIISPLFNQQKINKRDLEILKSIFGDYIFDFSGKNNITENKFNFYENYGNSKTILSRNKSSHYISKIGDIILDSIYKKVD